MEVSGQLHAQPAHFTIGDGGGHPVTAEQKAGWTPVPILPILTHEISLGSARNQTQISRTSSHYTKLYLLL